MGTLRIILWDQLSASLPIFKTADKKEDLILFIESYDQATYVKHHKKKLLFLWSAQRHFAEKLKESGYSLCYIAIDNGDGIKSITDAVKKTCSSYDNIDKIIITEPSEWHLLEEVKKWNKLFSFPVEIFPDDRFFVDQSFFKEWASKRKELRLEFFYREVRKKTGYLMNKKDPVGGAWNFDASNRESYDDREKITPVRSYKQDKVTKKVAQLINQYFPDHMGDTKTFSYAVTPKDALRVYEHFLKTRAALFGKYQDAMVQDEPFMFHSVISPYLNAGLLLPNQVCELMIEKYNAGEIPLEAAEGFLRQIIGWREFIRGIYWLAMPAYKKQNYFDAHRKLPSFFWTGKTKMNCLKQVINQTIDHSYAHHIQRLMITGNFALLTSLSVDEVCTWYHIVYLDAHEWVELPNTLGMALCGDGGLLSSKPYCSSGAYINKMSNYCKKCPYNVKEKTGEKACPFNYLYWYFIIKKESKLKKFKRMALPLATAKKFDEKERKVIIKDAEKFLESLS